jgi:hypothetical protein
MLSGVGHNVGCPARPTGRTKATFTGERREALETARGATEACKSLGKQTAVEVPAKLMFDEYRIAGTGLVPLSGFVEKGLPMFTNHAVRLAVDPVFAVGKI